MPQFCWRNFTVGVMTVMLAACSTSPPVQPARVQQRDRMPDLHLSAPIRLDAARAAAIAAVAAGPDELHILYERGDTSDVRYAVVNATGGMQRNEALPSELIARSPLFQDRRTLDLAFDSDAVLHALVDNRHLALRKGGWAFENGPPCSAFVRGGPRLICVGAPAAGYPTKHHLDTIGFGGPGGAIILPWRFTARKLAAYVHEPQGWRMQAVFDAASDLDTLELRGVASINGDIHALFRRGRHNGVFGISWRYERLAGGQPSAPPATADNTLSAQGVALYGSADDGRNWLQGSLAIDQETGDGVVLLVGTPSNEKMVSQRDLVKGLLGEPLVAFSGLGYDRAWVTHLGAGRFAVLLQESDTPRPFSTTRARAWLAVLKDGRWSMAAPIGAVGWLFSVGGDAPLVSRRDGRGAFVTLDPEARPIVRWLDPRP